MAVSENFSIRTFNRMINSHPAPAHMNERDASAYRRAMFDKWLEENDCFLDWDYDVSRRARYNVFFPDARIAMLFRLTWKV